MRRRRRENLFKTSMGAIVQLVALLCLVIIVYIIGRSIVKTSNTAKNKTQMTETVTVQQDGTTKEDTDEKKTEDTTKKTTSTTKKVTSTQNEKSTSSTAVSRQTRRTTATTEASTQAEISTAYGPETNQDGNSVEWISQQKDVIELEKDDYELRSKGKSGIQYIDANGDVAKVLLQPEDSVDGKSYEEYYYQGNELIYASIWNTSGNEMGEQYYYNNGNLIQWVDSSGLIYNRETRGNGFENSSNWERYLSAGMKAMRKSRSSTEASSENSSSTTITADSLSSAGSSSSTTAVNSKTGSTTATNSRAESTTATNSRTESTNSTNNIIRN